MNIHGRPLNGPLCNQQRCSLGMGSGLIVERFNCIILHYNGHNELAREWEREMGGKRRRRLRRWGIGGAYPVWFGTGEGESPHVNRWSIQNLSRMDWLEAKLTWVWCMAWWMSGEMPAEVEIVENKILIPPVCLALLTPPLFMRLQFPFSSAAQHWPELACQVDFELLCWCSFYVFYGHIF